MTERRDRAVRDARGTSANCNYNITNMVKTLARLKVLFLWLVSYAVLCAEAHSAPSIHTSMAPTSHVYSIGSLRAPQATSKKNTLLKYRAGYISDVLQSSLRSGFSGAFAGMVQVLSLMWLRTAVNYQYRYGVSIGQALRDLKAQGGIYRFYRGLSFALIQGPLAKFGGSCANELSLHYCKLYCSDRYHLVLSTVLGGILSGLWRFAIMPIDICKTMLQVDGKVGLDTLLTKVKFTCVVMLPQQS